MCFDFGCAEAMRSSSFARMEIWMMWIIGAIALLVVEMLTPRAFVFACFSIGALAAALSAALGLGGSACWWLFFVVSVLALVAARPLLAPMMNRSTAPSNVDELIGKDAVVIAAIAPHAPGRVKIKGEEWRAESAKEVAVGGVVKVLKVEGTRLLVEPK